jgi:PBSX family phage terminase large subunit
MTSGTVDRALSLRGAARAVLECRDKELLIAGPAGTGKSFSCLWKAHLMCLSNPGMKGLFVRKTHVSLTATGLATFKEHVAAEALDAGIVRWFGGSGAEPPGFKYSNGSTISVGGLDNPTKIMSSEYDLIYVQEATELTPDDWEKCTTRLRNGVVSFQQLLADCNPEGPDHWLKKRCDEGQTTMLYALHTDNPRLFDDAMVPTEKGAAYLDTLSKLSGVRRHRLYGGIWAAAEGVIYDTWNPAVHITERKILPKDWMRIWSVDFGYTNPFVWQMWAIDPDGRLILEKEIYRSQRIVADHCQQILDVVTHTHERQYLDAEHTRIDPNNSRWIYPRPIRILCDHDAEDRATLEREIGMPTAPAIKTVSDGLQACMQRLEVQPDGLPRVQVCRTALVDRDESVADRGLPLGFIGEIPGYVWEPAPDGKPNKDRPYKLNDHAMDAFRYAVADQDVRSPVGVRWL